MRTSPPARAPKWKLAVGPSSTGGHCNPPKKDTPRPKTKRKLQWDGRRGTITIKSNPIPTSWVTHKLENNNTKEVLPLLWRFWTPRQASQSQDPTKDWESVGLGNLVLKASGIWSQDFHRTQGNRDSSLGGHKLLGTSRCRRKEQWPQRTLNQNYLLMLMGLLWGLCSFPLGPGVHKILFVPSKTGISVSSSLMEFL